MQLSPNNGFENLCHINFLVKKMTDLTLSFCQQNPVVLNNEVLSINWGIIINIFIILQFYLDNIFYDTLTFNVFCTF